MSDRDKPSKLTPPAGIRAQIAGPQSRNDLTPVGEHAIEEDDEAARDRRIRETKNSSLITLRSVETMRREHREDIDGVHRKIDAVAVEVTKLGTVVAVEVGKLGVAAVSQTQQNELIIRMVDDLRTARKNTDHVITKTRIAEIETDATRQRTDIELEAEARKAEIEDTRETKALKREILKKLTLKIITVIGALASALVAGYSFGSC